MEIPVPSRKDQGRSCNTGPISLVIVAVLKMFTASTAKEFKFAKVG